MNNLLDFIKNPRDREDFFIALIVVALFGGAILYSIFPRNHYDDSLTEQELADHLNQSLADGSLKSKIFTDLEATDDLAAIKANRDKNVEKAAIKSKINQSDYMTDSDGLEQPAISDDLEDTNAELYNKTDNGIKSKEEIANAKRAEELKAAEELKMAEAKKAEELKVAEELKMAEAKKAEELKAAEELKMAEAKKAEELKANEELKMAETKKAEELKANEANKKQPINQSPKAKEEKIGQQPATSEYDNKEKKEENKVTKPATPKKKKPKTNPKTSKARSGCVIVVGAFKQAEGVNLILKKLRADNYKTTTGYTRGLKYVGVPIKCDGNNEQLIKELNDKYDKEAWILRR